MTTFEQPESVPFNDLSRSASNLWSSATAELEQMIDSGWVIMGKGVQSFEIAFARYLGGGQCVGVASGTDALELALRSVGVTAGTCVGLAANAGFYASCAILAIGATPVYLDVADKQITPGIEQIIDRPNSPGSRLGAVVITHLYGRVAFDIERIAEWCTTSGIPLIEDCSQAHGARRGMRHCGTFGSAAAFSFYPTKNLGALGDAGAVFSTHEEISNHARSLRQYGWSQKYVVTIAGGRNSRLDELQAILLSSSLKSLDLRNERRRAIIDHYTSVVPTLDILSVSPVRQEWVGHLCVINTAKRDRMRSELKDRGIATDIHFPVPDHRQPVWGTPLEVRLPFTERLADRVLSLPCFPEMTDDEVRLVATALSEVANG